MSTAISYGQGRNLVDVDTQTLMTRSFRYSYTSTRVTGTTFGSNGAQSISIAMPSQFAMVIPAGARLNFTLTVARGPDAIAGNNLETMMTHIGAQGIIKIFKIESPTKSAYVYDDRYPDSAQILLALQGLTDMNILTGPALHTSNITPVTGNFSDQGSYLKRLVATGLGINAENTQKSWDISMPFLTGVFFGRGYILDADVMGNGHNMQIDIGDAKSLMYNNLSTSYTMTNIKLMLSLVPYRSPNQNAVVTMYTKFMHLFQNTIPGFTSYTFQVPYTGVKYVVVEFIPIVNITDNGLTDRNLAAATTVSRDTQSWVTVTDFSIYMKGMLVKYIGKFQAPETLTPDLLFVAPVIFHKGVGSSMRSKFVFLLDTNGNGMNVTSTAMQINLTYTAKNNTPMMIRYTFADEVVVANTPSDAGVHY